MLLQALHYVRYPNMERLNKDTLTFRFVVILVVKSPNFHNHIETVHHITTNLSNVAKGGTTDNCLACYNVKIVLLVIKITIDHYFRCQTIIRIYTIWRHITDKNVTFLLAGTHTDQSHLQHLNMFIVKVHNISCCKYKLARCNVWWYLK